MHHLCHHRDKVSFEQCTSTLFALARISPSQSTRIGPCLVPFLAHTSPGCTQGPRTDQIRTFARIDLAVGECDSLTLLVTDEHCVSKSTHEASESSSQQQCDTEYAKCPHWDPSTASRLRSPSRDTPLPGDLETQTHAQLGPTNWRLTGSNLGHQPGLRGRERGARITCVVALDPRGTPAGPCGTRIYGTQETRVRAS